MKKMLAGVALTVLASALGGCYVAPGYSYVRDGYGGDAYYGRATTVYDDGYYAPAYDGYGYYGYPGGVSIGISSGWYGGSYRRGYRDYRGRGYHHDGGGYHRGHDWGRDGGRGSDHGGGSRGHGDGDHHGGGN